jgi:hypothetical protein
VADVALHDVPAVVGAPGDDVDLFAAPWPTSPSHKVPSAVERESPRVAQSVGPDLGLGTHGLEKGIVVGDAIGQVGFSRVDVDAQHLAQQGAEILAVAVGIMAAAAVPMPMYRYPSMGLNAIWPPLWFQSGCSMTRSISSASVLGVPVAGSATTKRLMRVCSG